MKTLMLIFSLIAFGAIGQQPLKFVKTTNQTKSEPKSSYGTTTHEFVASEDVIFHKAADHLRGKRSFYLKKGEKIIFISQNKVALKKETGNEMPADKYVITKIEGGYQINFGSGSNKPFQTYTSQGNSYEVVYK